MDSPFSDALLSSDFVGHILVKTPANPPPVPAGPQGASLPPPTDRVARPGLQPEVIFAEDLCKSCELCLSVCPTKVLKIDTSRVNAFGYFPAVIVNLGGCSGCGSCAKICPDSVITVRR